MSQRTIRFPDELEARIEAQAKEESRSFAGWVKRAVESALTDDTQAGSPVGRESATSTRGNASATGAASARGASRPSAQSRPPVKQRPPVAQKKTAGKGALRPYERPKSVKPVDARSETQRRVDLAIHGTAFEKDGKRVDPADVSVGCAECGGDIAQHPEFGRYCTGCGARIR